MRQEAGGKAGLFASVLDAHAHQAERGARLLRVVPLVLALHLLAIVHLSPDQRETAHLPIRAGDEDAPILVLLAARPALPSAGAATTAPAPSVPRRVVARKVPPRLKPATAEAKNRAIPTDVALDSVAGASVGKVVGELLREVLADSGPAPPLTPEEREAWVKRYMETLIRARFLHVRYPPQAAAAGITGQVVLRVSINSQGRLLKLELVGRCPHPVLCNAAQETMRNAEPFPPPPPELGTPFLMELPFRYHLY